MASQKRTKSGGANGVPARGKTAKSAPPSTGTSTPTTQAEDSPVSTFGSHGKPDKAVYDAEQEKIKAEIEVLQAKLSTLKNKISLATKNGPGNDRRIALRAELDGIRSLQSNHKLRRAKIFDQLKNIQDGIQKKVKDLQVNKAKIPFKSVEEVDAHIRNLERQVESGNMKLADEKRALLEISQVKRARRTVEGFQVEQDAVEADRRIADDLRKQLEDPESKAISERFDTIKAELDQLKTEEDTVHANRSKLYDERDGLQAQLTVLYNQKRESTQRYRDANDRYWDKINEDRARRAEKARAQRAAEEAQKKLEIAKRIREEAAVPAYQAQIEDCKILIDSLSGKSTGNVGLSLPEKADVAGVPKLDLRKVVEIPHDGLVAKKKKGVDEEAYFIGGKGKKDKKGSVKNGTIDSPTSSSSAPHLNVPLPTLSALLALSIPPPASSSDVPRVIEDLKTKKAWFEANQARVTAENISKAEAEITRLNIKTDTGCKTNPASDEPHGSHLNGAAPSAELSLRPGIDEPRGDSTQSKADQV